jgi:hypothetical protein
MSNGILSTVADSDDTHMTSKVLGMLWASLQRLSPVDLCEFLCYPDLAKNPAELVNIVECWGITPVKKQEAAVEAKARNDNREISARCEALTRENAELKQSLRQVVTSLAQQYESRIETLKLIHAREMQSP